MPPTHYPPKPGGGGGGGQRVSHTRTGPGRPPRAPQRIRKNRSFVTMSWPPFIVVDDKDICRAHSVSNCSKALRASWLV